LVDAVIGAERTPRGVLVPVRVRPDELLYPVRVAIGPQRPGADAVMMPALHRAATARSRVILAGPFVVEPRQVVEHSLADLGRRRGGGVLLRDAQVAPQKVVDHRREAEAGAG